MPPDPQLLARIDENVKYLRESFDDHKDAFNKHVAHDEQIQERYIKPVYEAYIRASYSKAFWGKGGTFAGWLINVAIAAATAWAAVKTIGHP